MEDREREEEAREDRRKVEDMVPKRFHKWLKVFGKQESERMPVCHDSESNPKFSPAFIGLLNNLMDYNASRAINRTGQVTILHK